MAGTIKSGVAQLSAFTDTPELFMIGPGTRYLLHTPNCQYARSLYAQVQGTSFIECPCLLAVSLLMHLLYCLLRTVCCRHAGCPDCRRLLAGTGHIPGAARVHLALRGCALAFFLGPAQLAATVTAALPKLTAARGAWSKLCVCSVRELCPTH